MPTAVYKTPGVYVEELSAFPPSIRGVPTAVPVFIGYTEKAEKNGKPIFLKPTKISALVDYEAYFGKGFKTTYKIVEILPGSPEADRYDFKILDRTDPKNPVMKYYALDPGGTVPATPSLTRFNLYESMELFYANGGGDCYVVSVNPYFKNDGAPNAVEEKPLLDGLAAAGEQVGPTIVVIPDAVKLPNDGVADEPWKSVAFTNVALAMLKQCATLQDRVSLLDVYGSQFVKVDKAKQVDNLTSVIDQFRLDVGEKFLSYGMSYFPFLDTTVLSASSLTYTSIATDDFPTLQKILGWQNTDLYAANETRKKAVQADIDKISTVDPKDDAEVKKLNQNLAAALPLLSDMLKIVTQKEDVLPPSGAMAGVYAFADSTQGVWNAPANVSLTAVDKPEVKINADQQGDLNLPVDGKAVNALRELPGRGTVVWGARTLDGNSDDYRYIQVRRTLIYIEQSIKQALNQFVFAANDGNTWSTVTAMISSFLQSVWSQGGLMGATASEAFTVQCGLGSTMTAKDILDGYMRVQVTLQMIRPAEFIVLTFKQKMEGAGS